MKTRAKDIIVLPNPKEMKDERYFLIEEKRKDSIYRDLFCIEPDSTDQEIGDIAAEIWTNYCVEREERNRPFLKFKWVKTVDVIEQTRKIKKLDHVNKWGKDYENCFSTKRNGLKLKLHNCHVEIKTTNGNVYKGNGYKYFP